MPGKSENFSLFLKQNKTKQIYLKTKIGKEGRRQVGREKERLSQWEALGASLFRGWEEGQVQGTSLTQVVSSAVAALP